jgi:hypothetical protein
MPSEKSSNIGIDALVGLLIGAFIGVLAGVIFARAEQNVFHPVFGARFGPAAGGVAGLVMGIAAPRVRGFAAGAGVLCGAVAVGTFAAVSTLWIKPLWPANLHGVQEQVVAADAATVGFFFAALGAWAVGRLSKSKRQSRRRRHRDDND